MAYHAQRASAGLIVSEGTQIVDGVELHAANGYLVNQFIDSRADPRTDGYGPPAQRGPSDRAMPELHSPALHGSGSTGAAAEPARSRS